MKKFHLMITALVALALLAGACSPQATPAAAPPPTTQAPTMATPAVTASPAAAAVIKIGKDDKLGSFLVDGDGITLYLFTKDTPNISNCYDKCATAWPPLLTVGTPVAGDGVDNSYFGSTTRKDGSIQVTYNGWPLYYYEKDQKAGDITGQNVGNVWFVVSPDGKKIASTAEATTTTTAASSSAPASVMVAKNDKLGSFLVDAKGMTLYLFTKDTTNTSNCYDKCATAWPPLLTGGTPIAGDGVDASKFGAAVRKDGSMQVTYNGWPLYYYEKDTKPGDTTGQNVGTVWFVISPAGDKITN